MISSNVCGELGASLTELQERASRLIGQVQPALRRRASLARRVAYRVRRAPGRMRLRVRYGSSRQRPMFDAASFARAPEMVAELAHRGPLWLLTGEHDACTPVLRQVASELAEIESCQLDVVPDLVLRAYPTPEAQREILDRTLAWAVRSFQGAKVSS